MTHPLGKRQVELLLRIARSSPFFFRPTRRGEPWPAMKTLIKRGLVWARRTQPHFWSPAEDCWRSLGNSWEAGLTPEGIEATALEQQRREAA